MKPVTLFVSHIEVTQVIQDACNSVPLYKGKKTFVRVYFDLEESKYADGLEIKGKIGIKQNKIKFRSSVNTLTLNTKSPRQLDQQRVDWNSSLNFEISEGILFARQDLQINLSKVEIVSPASAVDEEVTIAGKLPCKIPGDRIEGSPTIYINALCFRYWDAATQQYIEPEQENVDLIRQRLIATFPVGEQNVKWSSVRVNAIDQFRALSRVDNFREDQNENASRALRDLLLQTILHRNQDLYYGSPDDRTRDIRTLYLGVFDDPSGRLGGAAADSPGYVAHNIVGVTVADQYGQTGVHEIAHMLGRKHPGVPDRTKYGPQIGQRNELEVSESGKTARQGFLSDESEFCVGIHDDPHSRFPKLYEYNYWFDLMTYRFPQWVSKHTYTEIYERLGDLFFGAKDKFRIGEGKECVVIGEYDADRKSAKILYVLPNEYKIEPPDESDLAPDESDLVIHCNYESGISDKVYVRTRKVNDRDMPAFGIFQAAVKLEKTDSKEVSRKIKDIVLQYGKSDVDKYAELKEIPLCELKTFHKRFNKLLKKRAESRNKRNDSSSREIPARIIESARHFLPKNKSRMIFTYSVKNDEYLLRFRWKEFVPQVVTTILCQNPNDNSVWETVLVTTRTKGKVWISPDLVKKYYAPEGPCNSIIDQEDEKFHRPPYSYAVKDDRPMRCRARDEAVFLVILSAGFEEYPFPEQSINPVIEFPRRRLLSLQERRDYIEPLSVAKKKRIAEQVNFAGKFRQLED